MCVRKLILGYTGAGSKGPKPNKNTGEGYAQVQLAMTF
jgi:hypothetical protein